MATKTISVELDAYELLRGHKKTEKESFSQVIRRVLLEDGGHPAAGVLRALQDEEGKHQSGLVYRWPDQLVKATEKAIHRWAPAYTPPGS